MMSSIDYLVQSILRFSIFGTFVGHGCLAFRFEPKWLPYLAVIGVGPQSARILMPIIGLMDILVGLICLLTNGFSLIYAWAFVWGLSTAVMRPLAGESIFGLIERTGNFCPALALLYISNQTLWKTNLFICLVMIGTLILFSLIFRQTGVLKK